MDADDECLANDFEANGYLTGQNIEMNYEASEIKTVEDDDGNPQTTLHLEFFVPKRYTEQYAANAYALTFNRNIGLNSLSMPEEDEDGEAYENWQQQVRMYVGEFNDDQSACYSNRYANYTHCEEPVADLWQEEENSENACITDVSADIPWVNAMGNAFGGLNQAANGDAPDGGVDVQYNGNWIEIFLTATVETWTHFVQGDATQYEGVMTGGESLLNPQQAGVGRDRNGKYGNDAGWLGWPEDPDAGEFGNIVIDDERYTLYQIPFILRFPRTVEVKTDFKAAQDITLLTGVVAQDVISINLNPEDENVFAYVEAVLTTQVQFPYGIRAPVSGDMPAKMTVVIGDTVAGEGEHAEAIEFVHFDHESACMAANQHFAAEGTCEQSFKFRITPTAANPCSVAGPYTFEMWAICVGNKENHKHGGDAGCAIDDLVDSDNVEERRESNSYFKQTIQINHQSFCPELMDEVRVVGDFRVYKDEMFKTRVNNDADQSDTDSWKTTVFTNDQLYFEATYRTASAKSTKAGEDDFTTNGDVDDLDQDNGAEEYGNDSIIDYIRPTKIFMDVTLGQDRAGDATTYGEGENQITWDSENWADNMKFSLGAGNRIPGVEIVGQDEGEFTLTTGADGDGKGPVAKYQIVLCEVDSIAANEIQFGDEKPAYCFSNTKSIAREYLDFTRVQYAKEGFTNTIDENEVAFNMRMDERILPVKPSSDESFARVTIQAEVYYKGNRHPTTKGFADGGNRRRLQAGEAQTRRQAHSMSVGYNIFNDKRLRTCSVDNEDDHGAVRLKFAFNSARDMPTAGDMAGFTSDITMQIDEYHNAQGSVSVEHVERCEGGKCRDLYTRKSLAKNGMRRMEGSAMEGSARRRVEQEGSAFEGSARRRVEQEGSAMEGSARRRLQEDEGFYLYVTLGFRSTSNPAGRILNVFQSHVVDTRNAMHRKIPIFAAAKVVEMVVDNCNGKLNLSGMVDRKYQPGRGKLDHDMLMDDLSRQFGEGMEGELREAGERSGAFRPAGILAFALSLLYLAW